MVRKRKKRKPKFQLGFQIKRKTKKKVKKLPKIKRLTRKEAGDILRDRIKRRQLR